MNEVNKQTWRITHAERTKIGRPYGTCTSTLHVTQDARRAKTALAGRPGLFSSLPPGGQDREAKVCVPLTMGRCPSLTNLYRHGRRQDCRSRSAGPALRCGTSRAPNVQPELTRHRFHFRRQRVTNRARLLMEYLCGSRTLWRHLRNRIHWTR
jgi:hypothetical protein